MWRRRFVAALGVVLTACSGPGPQSPTVQPTPPLASPTVDRAPAPTPAIAPSPTVIGRLTDDPTAVVVFAASALGAPLSELGSAFMLASSDATGVMYKFDDSSQLRTLIQQGADADVFASGDPGQMRMLRDANLLDGQEVTLVGDRLSIVVSKTNPQGIQAFTDLARSGVRYIVPEPASSTTAALLAAFDAANADAAYGADFRSKAERNILARDGDDGFVIDRIASGEVNAGVVYASKVATTLDPQTRGQVQLIAIPDALTTSVEYPIAVLKNGTNVRGARAFVNYALSAPAQAVFARWGFSRKATP